MNALIQLPALDSHCHIDLYPSPAAVVARAEEAGVRTIAVTNAPRVFAHTQGLVAGSALVRAALGLHPELVATHGRELDRLLELLPQTRYVGEVGLDFVTRDTDNRRQQSRVFEAILGRCAEAGDKVMTVHSRRAASEVIDAIGPSYPGVVILHWFSGSVRELTRGAAMGMYFSVNPAMTESVSGRKLIAAMPPDRVLTETDGPFVQRAGQAAEPSDVYGVLSYLAECWRCSAADAQARVNQTFVRAVGDF